MRIRKLALGKLSLLLAVGLLPLLAAGCSVEREWVTSRDPLEAEAQEEAREQAAFFQIEGDPELDAAAREYQKYVDRQSDLLVDRTEGFTAAVEAGDLEKARDLYASSRIPWERIEPIAEKFGNLDPEVDAREGDVPQARWTGFHRLEKALWVENTTVGQEKYTEELVSDVERLQREVDNVRLQPSDPVFGAVELLNEVSATKITGEEERYSHADLYDIAANVEGAEVAFNFVRPAVESQDPELVAEIEGAFGDVYDEIEPYRRGDGWASYEAVDENGRRQLSQKIDALAEPLSRVGRVLTS